jgi:hypothetical protein
MRDARPLLVLVVLVLGLLAPTNAAAETTLEKELDRPALDEFTVDGAPEVLVWSVNTKEHPLRSDSYVQFGDDRPIQMNRPGSRTSFVGTDGATAVFSVKRGGGDFDLKLFDLGSLTRSDPPRGVNTPAAENWPSISGRWLLFLRDDSNIAAPGQGRLRMILFNTVTGERRVLANEPAASSLLETGQVNGDWATWISCDEDYSTFTASHCQVYRYRISRDRIVQIPNPHKQQFGSMVTPDGTVYFTRNRNRHSWECGRGAHIVRYPVGGPAESIASVPSGFAVLWGRAVTEGGGSITLHMYRIPCTFDPGGIYEIEDADSA